MATLIFLSHAAQDGPLAEYLEETMRGAQPDLTVFRTTRPDQLVPGRSWFRDIEDNLRAASGYLVLLTPNSADRPWILFETGAAWYSQHVLVPVVVGMDKGELREPLRLLQLLSLEEPGEAAAAFFQLGLTLADPRGFTAAVKAIAAGLPKGTDQPSWDELSVNGSRYVWGGPLHSLPDGAGQPAPDALIPALHEAHLEVRSGFHGDPDGAEASLGFRPVYLVDQHGAKHSLWTKDRQVLYARPTAE